MAEKSFNEIIAMMQTHFTNKTYGEGLALATTTLKNYPEEFPLINYWRMSMAGGLGAYPQVLQILEETLAAGCWYAESVLRGSPWLEALQGNEEFERLAAISQQMRGADPLDQTPMLTLRQEDTCEPGAEPGCPLLIFLHGNQQAARQHVRQWHSLSNQGWLVALPQSSRALWTEAYTWIDLDSAEQDVTVHLHKLTEQYSINTDSILLAGTAMGAEVALGIALNGNFPCHGFILYALAGPNTGDLAAWEPLIEGARGRALRGVIVIGEEDENILPDNVRQLADMLNQAHLSTELITIPGLGGHTYPTGFDEVLQRAIKYIIG